MGMETGKSVEDVLQFSIPSLSVNVRIVSWDAKTGTMFFFSNNIFVCLFFMKSNSIPFPTVGQI